RLTAAGAWDGLHKALDGLDPNDLQDLAQRAQTARNIVYSAPIPKDMRKEILQAYRQLQTEYGDSMSVAVRSSATAEDLPTASFAGQQDTYLNVRGDEMLLDSCRRCFASLFIDRAIHYRIDQGFDHFKVALSIGVMKMVRSDQAASGVMFSLDTESGFRDVVFITAAYGLGENVVQGAVDPDEFTVFKPTFLAGHRRVLRRVLGSKKIKMIYTDGDIRATTRNIPVPREAQEQFSLTDDDVLTLADYAIKVEQHYSEQAGQAKPMDMEWAKDGIDGHLYLVQARPETAVSRKDTRILEEYELQGQGPVLTQGRAVGVGIAAARAHVIPHVTEIRDFQKGEILVADTTTPDWEPIMKHAAGIITNRGGRTCHAAIIARELGIPAIVGTDNATRAIASGEMVTLSCAEGNTGNVYRGAIPFAIKRHDLTAIPRPATTIMVNIGNPDRAFKTRFLPNDGVGLARMEFIIAEAIRIHPMALAHPDRVEDPAEREAINHLTRGYPRPADFLIERLAEGVGTIAAAFHPKPVIVRMSDFKSNEYATLLGGRWFEAHEDNPMLGFRGASRYTHPDYADGFALECAAMRRVRDELGLTNIKLMIPFCRRVDEAERVINQMAHLGLARGSNGLEIYMMCEIPNNVLLLDDFARFFDGFSIGSNDLTQLTLGVDRDAHIVAFDYDERDPGVKAMIRMAVEGCRRVGRHSGLCGQAPSDYPEMAEFLVEIGIDSVSLNPDAVVSTTLHILEVEKRLGRLPRSGAG
ncbi:MAG: phosphoenolpyruvate synthase, partial [Gammaproteobacteria bacterium]|nr:phosphoenolpyruvate synthase [Gammaproteobacteria bacterium]